MSDEDLMYMDRALDARIAVKVFKWDVWQSKHGYFEIKTHEGERLTAFFGREIPKYDSQTGKKLPPPEWWEDCDNIPYYSGNIGDAWGIIDAIYKEYTSLIRVERRAFDKYECTMAANGEKYTADAQTAPLAICLAALNLIEAQEGK